MRATRKPVRVPTPEEFAAFRGAHCHQLWARVGIARFQPTVLCDQCNSADGAAKRRLKLPENFSFTPAEIGRFVLSTPHGKHVIDYDVAASIYSAL